MKEYKLIKKYPSLPINWEEGMLVGQGDRQNGTYTPCNGKYEDEGRPFCLPLSEVWDNPEFWEEVVEKDYEILSIIGTNKHPLPKTTLYLKDVYKKDFTGHLNDESNCWQIHSVKRLSDSEIFTIGDKAKTITSDGTHVINSFEIGQKQINRSTTEGVDRIWINWGNDEEDNWLESIESIERIREPLFTTEDGVDIFERDSFYYIGDAFNVCSTKCLYEGDGDFIKSKKFSTKEKAEEFIILNKPYLSINDVINNYHYTPSSIKHRLTELIKSRIFWKKN